MGPPSPAPRHRRGVTRGFPPLFWRWVKRTWAHTQVQAQHTFVLYIKYVVYVLHVYTRTQMHSHTASRTCRGGGRAPRELPRGRPAALPAGSRCSSAPADRALTPELPEQRSGGRWSKSPSAQAVPGPPGRLPRRAHGAATARLGATFAVLVTKAMPGSLVASRARELSPARAGLSRARPGLTRPRPDGSPRAAPRCFWGHSPGATGSRPCPAPLAPTRPGHAWGLKQRGKERKEAPAEPGEARLRIQGGRGGWERPLAGHNAPVLNINPRERPGRRASVFA